MAAGGDDDMLRLVAVIDHQRRELDRTRAAAAEQSVVAMARGVLMERLGLTSAEIDRMASAFEHEDLRAALTLQKSA